MGSIRQNRSMTRKEYLRQQKAQIDKINRILDIDPEGSVYNLEDHSVPKRSPVSQAIRQKAREMNIVKIDASGAEIPEEAARFLEAVEKDLSSVPDYHTLKNASGVLRD